ncbi:MAG: NAD(P)/FAD-dependent oxidoreductase [Bacteroidota bacterium]
MKKNKRIIIIGGGAAGFFAAANLSSFVKSNEFEIFILEKSNKILSKVKISGGGRCNVTNVSNQISDLLKNYPRGAKELKRVFRKFSNKDTVEWFESKGALLKAEPDGRMFPETDNSQTIIDCLLNECNNSNVKIQLNSNVKSIKKEDNQFKITCEETIYFADYVLICSGGFAKSSGYSFIENTGHSISPLAPSLFTFNIKKNPVTELMGLSVKNAKVRINGTNFQYSGPVLITHWGLSGPAVLKLSAFAALHLQKVNYQAGITVNWVNAENEEQVRTEIRNLILNKKTSSPQNTNFYNLPERLWIYLINKSEINPHKNWSEQNAKSINKLINSLYSDSYDINGKTTFKEEFVTSGGVNLNEINFETMESKLCSNLFFAGEVLNIDGITGGFNFQAAWSTAWVASQSIVSKIND